MSRFSLYFGTGLASTGAGHFLSLVSRSVPNFSWLYWSVFLALIVVCLVMCTRIGRQIYSGQFATSPSVLLTLSSITLITYLMGVIWGWGF
ncbi:hypothetical protein NIES204_45210 (plasmid) [Planktothrix agardhii NIES-204]|jgi:hypothetical protein|nr:hypothetical protein NIES204_45210 [Planktothrix agardhii NIES-204]